MNAPTLELLPDGEADRLTRAVRADRLDVEDIDGQWTILAHRGTWCRIVGYIVNVAPRRNKRPRWEYSRLSNHEWTHCDYGEYEAVAR